MTKEDRLWNIVNNNTHMFTSLLDCKLITSTIIWIIWNFIAFWSNRSPMKSYFWTPRMWSKSASCKCNCATTQLLLISCERKKCSIIINIVERIKNNIRCRNVDVSIFIESYFFPYIAYKYRLKPEMSAFLKHTVYIKCFSLCRR